MGNLRSIKKDMLKAKGLRKHYKGPIPIYNRKGEKTGAYIGGRLRFISLTTTKNKK